MLPKEMLLVVTVSVERKSPDVPRKGGRGAMVADGGEVEVSTVDVDGGVDEAELLDDEESVVELEVEEVVVDWPVFSLTVFTKGGTNALALAVVVVSTVVVDRLLVTDVACTKIDTTELPGTHPFATHVYPGTQHPPPMFLLQVENPFGQSAMDPRQRFPGGQQPTSPSPVSVTI